MSKFRPRVVNQERERLYDDVMRQRITANVVRDENTRLRTKLQMADNEITRKDRLIDDLILQQENLGGNMKRKFNIRVESHLEINLKRKVRDLQNELQSSKDENDSLKRNIRATR